LELYQKLLQSDVVFDGRYIFEPIAIETLGVYNTSARQLLSNLGRKISESTGEAREASFLFQRCLVLTSDLQSSDFSPNWLALLNWGTLSYVYSNEVESAIIFLRLSKSEFLLLLMVKPLVIRQFSLLSSRNGHLQLSVAISAKLEDGNVRAAVRLLMSRDSPAVPSLESLKALGERHPPACSDLTDMFTPQPDRCLSVDVSEVRKAILSFSSGSAGGPDGLRPQHIRDMMLRQESGADFLGALTEFVNLIIAGHCPTDVAPVFTAVAFWL